MDRIRINISNFKYPRNEKEKFTFTKKEEVSIKKDLDMLESMILDKCRSIFSVSKRDGLFSGNLKIKSFDIYTFGKASTGIGLFCKLREEMKRKILNQNRIRQLHLDFGEKRSLKK